MRALDVTKFFLFDVPVCVCAYIAISTIIVLYKLLSRLRIVRA
jgi:hypothetical protein